MGGQSEGVSLVSVCFTPWAQIRRRGNCGCTMRVLPLTRPSPHSSAHFSPWPDPAAVSGPQCSPCDLSLGQGFLAPSGRGRVEEGGLRRTWGRSPAGTIPGEPSPDRQPLQPCLKVDVDMAVVGQEQRDGRRRNRVRWRPQNGRLEGSHPNFDPDSPAVLVIKHRDGT